MIVYRLQPRLNVLDEDKNWLVLKSENQVDWKTDFVGTYQQCYDYYLEHKKHQEEKSND